MRARPSVSSASLSMLFWPTESGLGRTPREMPQNNKGYDIESHTLDGDLLFIEVKGRIEGADR